ncbi:hypothetical protein UFOVP112_119 [uncultured Caudovirales phage]|uniref:YHYH domain-containing protein n=1 Tax=uncultured Caudovirales phage TaxID=2100421 RepID=A0A6J5L6R7_9CAUD|nr:hypothetical protein UFOVP112_119 [uncultured Caudovirales phage]
MALLNTINFLPQVFQTATNQRFLGATMDQMVSSQINIPVAGYIGRTVSPTSRTGDNYVPEATAERQQYQLEASVVISDAEDNIKFNSNYIDLLNSIKHYGGLTNNHQRLFSSTNYSYDGHFDYDKFINYYNYFWLPNGPAAVSVYANQTPYQADYTVTKNTNISGYNFSGVGTHPNLQLTLARGGRYTFTVNQPGSKFWIQSEPGVSGVDSSISLISTRDVFGVTNNGTDTGVITFNVPLTTAQDFYTAMPIVASVDAAVTLRYTDIQNKLLSQFIEDFPAGFDGLINNLQNKTFIFIGNDKDDVYWTTPSLGSYSGLDRTGFASGYVVTNDLRKNAWKITLIPNGAGDYIIQITPDAGIVQSREKVFISSGQTYAANQFWLNNNLEYTLVPPITATQDYLYYQDGTDPEFLGVIKLVDNTASTINVATDILGKVGYTSPNGVIFTNGLKIKFDSSVEPSTYANKEYYVDGVGTSIALVDVSQLVVSESIGLDIATTPDYITINRVSQDRNPWSRYNRWFHKDVINAVAKYNQTSADYGPNIAARRPIVEFEPNLQLFNYGQQASHNVDYITFTSTDAFADIEGKTSALVDGYTLKQNDRIIFANDYDTSTINEVWQVDIQYINSTNYITLIKTPEDPILPGQNILITAGSNAGNTYRFTGTEWIQCQAKTDVNQPPLFDLVDASGYSFADTTVYPDTTFAGTKFFGYGVGTGSNDTVLGFPLTYQNFNNIGDISFSNYYDTDTFTHTHPTKQVTTTLNCNSGYLKKNNGLTTSTQLNNWIENKEKSSQFQVFTKNFDGYVVAIDGVEKAFVQIDVLPLPQVTVPHLKVYLNNTLLMPDTDYQLVKFGIYDIVTLTNLPAVDDKIDVLVFSDKPSNVAYYQIPDNLDSNALNENFNTITLGQLRTHYNKLIENKSCTSINEIPTQDDYLKAQGGTLTQHCCPAVYAMTFLTDPTVNFENGITLARKEYTKFKNKFLSLCSSLTTIDYNNPVTGVDTILQNINALKNSSFPWYYSDMVPQGGSYTPVTYTVLNSRQTRYEIRTIFNNTQLGARAVLVYVDGVQQILGIDYVFSTETPTVVFTNGLPVGSKIVIRDYPSTDGNYIPETPTKLGLYPKFEPRIYEDTAYQAPINVIQGHDGSLTPAFNDFRDDYLLELEKRIYNNIKTDYNTNPISIHNSIPGRFRTTDYTFDEYNQVLSRSFLTWAGANNVDYASNTAFNINNPWTWNYSNFTDAIDGSLLQGSWRAIYQYWYDTDTPNLTPWKMLGFGSKPTWWTERYGNGPYTGGNTLLWEDLEAGYVWNNGDPYYDTVFARPGLTKVIPVDSAGNLLNPTQISVVRQYNTAYANADFSAGQQGPAETAWRRSSDYPFALQATLALLKPAEYFGTQLDTSRFYTNPITGQVSNSVNQKITPSILTVNGNTTSGTVERTSGYINWIADGIKNTGIDPITKILDYFTNFSVRLNYKVGGFIDDRFLTVSAEQTTPGSTNASVVIPETNYKIYLNKSNPIGSAVYSAVIIEKTTSGYAVTGYDPTTPFFNIIPSIANNNYETIAINEISAKMYKDSAKESQLIPYGTEFATIQQVADFLTSYQRYLISQGFLFTQFDTELETQRDWALSIKEVMYWAQQGWSAGNVIILNPTATYLKLNTIGKVVDAITNTTNGSKLLDQNFLPIKHSNFNILRAENPTTGNQCVINTIDGAIICYAKLDFVQHEHVIVFDNVSDFGDIVYVPNQGTRQYRLKLSGAKTGGWTGALSAPGYFYSDPVISTWSSGTDYQLGDIVAYNNSYYAATQKIPAASTFNAGGWTQVNKADIKNGLLPNFTQSAQEIEHIYDIDAPVVDEVIQEYSAGLIGFRQRQYLTDLGVGIPTQTKFYQGFIKEKGTINSVEALTKANFDNVNGTIETYEEWAFRVGQYGGVNSNAFREFVLDQSVFTTNPVAFTITDNYTTGNIIANLRIDANLTLSNIYNSSNLTNVTAGMYNNRSIDQVYATDLPTVGYVNLQDADYTIFDLTTYTGSLDGMGAGDKIWVAKDSANQWDILRVDATNLTAVTLTYILDNYAQLTFDYAHSFNVGDSFLLKYFDPVFDGIYEVIEAPNATTVTIIIKEIPSTDYVSITALQTLIRALVINGSGVVYTLDSAKVDTVSDLINLPIPLNGWINNDHVWVDNASSAGWGVYTFNQPWHANATTKLTHTITANAKFGTSVRISSDEQYVYVGAPGEKLVYANATSTGTSTIISNASAGFGTNIESQGNLVVVSSTANVHVYRNVNGTITPVQLISSANVSGNISSISMSTDQKWLYIGGNNVVEAYTTTNAAWANVHYTWVGKISSVGAFGSVVKTNTTGNILVVGAPTANVTAAHNGNVSVYSRSANAFTKTQTLSSVFQNDSAGFGTSLDLDSTFGNLYVGIPRSLRSGYANGLVERFILVGSSYQYHSNIAHPHGDVGAFGTSISVSGDTKVLAVGSLGSSSEENTTFDQDETLIDADTTNFVDHIINSGATYIFEPLIDQTLAGDLGHYVYVQELEAQLHSGDLFGNSLDITRGLIAVGAPGATSTNGSAYLFHNNSQSTGWNITRHEQPQVDIDSVSRTFIYNKTDNTILAALDYVDPAKGKVLNSVARDIDYQLPSDPALYNHGTGEIHSDQYWGPKEVGKIWWDLSAVRYIDYEQDATIYRLNNWGTRFPGSEILVYEWVASSVLPSLYVENGGSGVPVYADDSSYSTYGYVEPSGTVKLKYYFWVKNLDTVNTHAGKHNSIISITNAIENPHSQNIPYATILRDDTIALHNVNHLLTGQNSILHLGYQPGKSSIIHSEYTLVQEGNPRSPIPSTILNKFVDSLSGIDRAGNTVPDPALLPSQRYGISIRPRQTMIMNHDLALLNYLTLVNGYLLDYPVVERKVLTILNSEESIPSPKTGAYSGTVETIEELGYLELPDNDGDVDFPAGYSVLVKSDTTYAGKWAIYTLNSSLTAFEVSRVQAYKTNLYWTYADWYDSTYDPTSTPDVTVATALDLGKLNLVTDTYIKVLDTGNGKFAVYKVDSNLALTLVGIESGTIQINTNFDSTNRIELRNILLAMQNEIFIDDQAGKFNSIFFAMIKYILTEQKNLDWVFKTSFISSTQYIRKLQKFPSYIADNQSYYLDYINEVKPYRTIVREFVIDYIGNDSYNSDVTDFDLPPYWDANLQVYRSPSGEQPYDSTIRSTGVNSQWNENHTYGIVDVIIEDAGSGFLFSPQIIFSGGGGSGAEAYAEISGTGGIARIYITNPGTGYTSIPNIVINGTGSGARARAVLRNVYDGNNTGHNLVRSIKTNIKFDRINYTNASTFVMWDDLTASANIGQQIAPNTILVLNGSLYQLANAYTITGNIANNTIDFPISDTTQITATSFNNANDRIVATQGNVDFALIDDGITYPGVTLDGNTYVGTDIDSIVQSRYTDSVGVNPSDILVDGGAYVDRYESHAPQELVPGRMFDSLNLTVYDRDQLAFRLFDNMSSDHEFYRIALANITALSSNLSINDTVIHVTDASKLPAPNRLAAVPGVVFINGEKITYYRNYATESVSPWEANATFTTDTLISYSGNVYLTLGNVYGMNFANVTANVTTVNLNSLGQIRRAVDGTSPALVHAVNSLVVDSSMQQQIPNTAINTSTLSANVVYSATDVSAISFALHLTSNVSASIGDLITQIDANTSVTSLTVRVLETVANTKTVPVVITGGGITGLPDVFDNPLGFDIMGFDNTTSQIYINGNITPAYIISGTIIGTVTPSGTVTVSANTVVETANLWYNRGFGVPSDGHGIINSTTSQAEFLKASRGYSA